MNEITSERLDIAGRFHPAKVVGDTIVGADGTVIVEILGGIPSIHRYGVGMVGAPGGRAAIVGLFYDSDDGERVADWLESLIAFYWGIESGMDYLAARMNALWRDLHRRHNEQIDDG